MQLSFLPVSEKPAESSIQYNKAFVRYVVVAFCKLDILFGSSSVYYREMCEN